MKQKVWEIRRKRQMSKQRRLLEKKTYAELEEKDQSQNKVLYLTEKVWWISRKRSISKQKPLLKRKGFVS